MVYSTTWSVPPKQTGKIRVVLDCSAEFKEVSLNQNLMSGPDLTNEIVGV